jgi:hypothetical protein
MWKIAGLLNDDLDSLGSSDLVGSIAGKKLEVVFCHVS